MSALSLHQGGIFHLRDDPRNGGGAIEWIPDGALLIEDGYVAAIGTAAALTRDGVRTHRHDGIIIPGFIDAHVHYPQTDMIGAYGKTLLEWLNNYTFPMEARFSDAVYAAQVAEAFLDELLRNGVTTAVVFATSHVNSVDAIFTAARARDMRIVAGKVLMDCNAPQELLDAPGGGISESADLIQRWHNKDRLLYAITPRFALTSSSEQLEAAGRLAAAHPDVYVHSHLAESADECETVKQQFPHERDYLAVYERYGLVRPKSVFAHALRMSGDGFQRLAHAGACTAFCPSSNLFLGNGFFDLAAARAAGTHVALGTDVGGGTSFSMLATMGEAYKVCQGKGAQLDPFDAFYLATLGAARGLKLDDRLGNFSPGKEADFTVLDPAATPLLARRGALCQSVHELLFSLMIMGDDRAIRETWVSGKRAHFAHAVSHNSAPAPWRARLFS